MKKFKIVYDVNEIDVKSQFEGEYQYCVKSLMDTCCYSEEFATDELKVAISKGVDVTHSFVNRVPQNGDFVNEITYLGDEVEKFDNRQDAKRELEGIVTVLRADSKKAMVDLLAFKNKLNDSEFADKDKLEEVYNLITKDEIVAIESAIANMDYAISKLGVERFIEKLNEMEETYKELKAAHNDIISDVDYWNRDEDNLDDKLCDMNHVKDSADDLVDSFTKIHEEIESLEIEDEILSEFDYNELSEKIDSLQSTSDENYDYIDKAKDYAYKIGCELDSLSQE